MSDRYPPLLRLPLELQGPIYKDVFLQPYRRPHLLECCREIYRNSRKFLYQRPLSFPNQAALQQWIQRIPSEYYQYINDIAVQIEDADLTPLLLLSASSSTRLDSAARPLQTWDVYERCAGELRQALSRIPNVKNITIKASPGRQSYLYTDFLDMILELVAIVYPGLFKLTLSGNMHRQSLSFLCTLKELRELSLDGFLGSTAPQLAEILSSLRLTKISLVSHHSSLTPIHYQHNNAPGRLQSFESSLIRVPSLLTSFSVTEQYSSASSVVPFTSEILGSLRNHATLSYLSITSSFTPEPSTLESLEECLGESSSIQRLELDWPNFEPDVFDRYTLLTPNLQTVWIRADSLSTARNILFRLLRSRETGNAPGLRQVVFGRTAPFNEPERGTSDRNAMVPYETVGNFALVVGTSWQQVDIMLEKSFATVKQGMVALGVLVAWCTNPS